MEAHLTTGNFWQRAEQAYNLVLKDMERAHRDPRSKTQQSMTASVDGLDDSTAALVATAFETFGAPPPPGRLSVARVQHDGVTRVDVTLFFR